MKTRASIRRNSAPAVLSAALASVAAPAFSATAETFNAEHDAVQNTSQDSAYRKIQAALLPERLKSLKPLAPGQSGTQVYRATAATGHEIFAKVVQAWEDVDEPEELRAEMARSDWAAERGFGPTVLYADSRQGLLLTEFLPNEMGEWHEGGMEPRLSATLTLMHKLHQTEVSSELSFFQTKKLFLPGRTS